MTGEEKEKKRDRDRERRINRRALESSQVIHELLVDKETETTQGNNEASNVDFE